MMITLKAVSLSTLVVLGLATPPFIAPVQAQMSANPPEVAAKIREMGPRLGREVIRGTRKLYAPLQKMAPKDDVKITRNLAYGTHERHRLDVFQPTTTSTQPAPVVVFLHGGGYVRGDKRGFGNVGVYFARHGVVGITANYRLAPQSKWPSGPEDIGNMIKWIKANVATSGGDANKIFLMGNSAGTGHVASYVFFDEFHVKDDGVAGAILVSGPTYDVKPQHQKAYFGEDVAKYPNMSAINKMDGRKIPLFVAFAELDMPPIQRQNMLLIDALFKPHFDRCPYQHQG
jgi:acetyl esterase